MCIQNSVGQPPKHEKKVAEAYIGSAIQLCLEKANT